MYVLMWRHVYVYEYDCFMYVHMCPFCIYMYVMTMYSAVGVYKLDLLLLSSSSSSLLLFSLSLLFY